MKCYLVVSIVKVYFKALKRDNMMWEIARAYNICYGHNSSVISGPLFHF